MPKITFLPRGTAIDVPTNTKVLVAARKAKVNIVFGCAACQCGTCGVKTDGPLSVKKANEEALLAKMGLNEMAGVRLACQARIMNDDVTVDLSFQNSYDPDRG